MKLFVTGATGFIGSHFARRALNMGHYVTATRRPQSAVPPNLERTNWMQVSLDQIAPTDFEGCDALVHFAAAGVSPQKASWSEMRRFNVEGSLSLIERAAAAGVRRIVLAGSFAEYGQSADRYELIPPDAPLLPTTFYASSKAACFVSAHGAAVELGLELCYLRVFSAFGEGQFESNFWPALKRAALAGEAFKMTPGDQIRDYVAVEAVAEAFLHAVERSDAKPGVPLIRNVGSGQPVTMSDFARTWWKRWGAEGQLQVGALPYRNNEVMRFVPLMTD